MFAISHSLRAASLLEQHAIFKYISPQCRTCTLNMYISLLIRSLSCFGHVQCFKTKHRNGFWNHILHSKSNCSLRQAAVWRSITMRHNHIIVISVVWADTFKACILWNVCGWCSNNLGEGFWLVGEQFNFLHAPQRKWFHVTQTVHVDLDAAAIK